MVQPTIATTNAAVTPYQRKRHALRASSRTFSTAGVMPASCASKPRFRHHQHIARLQATFCFMSPSLTNASSLILSSCGACRSRNAPGAPELPAANWLKPPTASTASKTVMPSRYGSA